MNKKLIFILSIITLLLTSCMKSITWNNIWDTHKIEWVDIVYVWDYDWKKLFTYIPDLPETITFTWEESKDYCNELAVWWYIDWRLPTIQELKTMAAWAWWVDIVDIDKDWLDWFDWNWNNTNWNFASASNLYWSSTTYPNTTTNAWSVYFYYGTANYNKNNTSFVRCTR